MARSVKAANCEKQSCPWCSAVIYINHAALEICYEEPVCRKYLKACEQMQGKAQGRIYVIEIRALETDSKSKPS